MVGDPKKRLSAGDALHHPWFTEANDINQEVGPIDVNILKRLKKFKGVSKLKKAAMNMLVKMSDSASIDSLRKQFEKMDIDRTGMISSDELKVAIHKNTSVNLTDGEIDDIINEVDYFGNKKINYSEFLTATIDLNDFLTENKLNALFS